jgi:hypothetical protein
MKLVFKEDPKEWRKNALLTALGLALLSSLLRWRKHLPEKILYGLLIVSAVVAFCAWLQPRWFRGWHRLSLWLGFYSGQIFGRCVLVLVFIFMITPTGWVLRLVGKDILRLKRPRHAKTYWHKAQDKNSLDRLF